MATTTVNVTLSDEDHAKAASKKDQLDMTWEEFILKASEEL